MDHSETLRREKVEYQNKIANIRQRTSEENLEAEEIKAEIPQIRENIAHRQKQHEILLSELIIKNEQDQIEFENTKAQDELSLRELEI